MIIHPDLYWLQDVETNVQDPDWRQVNLDEIMDSLRDYISDVNYILTGSAILDICFADMLGQGRYTELLELHTIALNTFDSDNQIFSPFDSIENISLSNVERFASEYFKLKLNLIHVALLLHKGDLAKQELEHIHKLYDKANLVDQLEACCLVLKYHAYGYEMDLDFDLILTTQRLASKLPDDLYLKSEVAIAYYHYSRGDIPAMEKVLRKAMKLVVDVAPLNSETEEIDTLEISAVSAELNFYLAVLYRELSQFDKAFSKLDIASEQYARLNNHVQNMLVLYETSMIYKNQEEYVKALQWINLAFDEFEGLKEKQDYHQAMLDHGKGIILLGLQKYDEALTLLQGVLPIWEKQKHDYHSALVNNDIGATIFGLAHPTAALPYLKKAKMLCEPIKDRAYVQELIKIIDKNIANASGKL